MPFGCFRSGLPLQLYSLHDLPPFVLLVFECFRSRASESQNSKVCLHKSLLGRFSSMVTGSTSPAPISDRNPHQIKKAPVNIPPASSGMLGHVRKVGTPFQEICLEEHQRIC